MSELDLEPSWGQELRRSFVTYLLCGLCILMFGLQWWKGSGGEAGMAYPGYVDGLELFNGKYWGLLTSFFLHANLVHVAFNVYWLYHMGRGVERAIGWKPYLLFWFAATAVSSLMQVAVSGEIGVGASGFAYALFGFIWVGSRTNPDLARILDRQTVILFVVWLFLCFFITWTGAASIGNGAHMGGMLYGAWCAYTFLIRDTPAWKRGVVAITLLAFVPLFYAPWLGTWNLAQGAKAFGQKKYASAVTYLERVNLPGYEAYTLQLEGLSLSNLGRSRETVALYKNLLTSHQESELSDPGYFYNEYAWALATSPDDQVRNPEDAIYYAQLACEKSHYQDGGILDTLAAAYASAGQFDQAAKWEQKAIEVNTDPQGAGELKDHLKLFQAGKPYRETAPVSPVSAGN